MPFHVNVKCAALGESALANAALVGLLAKVNSPVPVEVLSRGKPLPAELANFRLLSRVTSHVYFQMVARHLFIALWTSDDALPGVRVHMLLVARLVKRLKGAQLAVELFPGLRRQVQLHVDVQVVLGAALLLADVTNKRANLQVSLLMSLQRALLVESLAARFAKMREVLVVSPHVSLEIIVGRQFQAAECTSERRAVHRSMDLQVLEPLEYFVTVRTLYWTAGRFGDCWRCFPLSLRFSLVCPLVLGKLPFTTKPKSAGLALVFRPFMWLNNHSYWHYYSRLQFISGFQN